MARHNKPWPQRRNAIQTIDPQLSQFWSVILRKQLMTIAIDDIPANDQSQAWDVQHRRVVRVSLAHFHRSQHMSLDSELTLSGG
jgi:Zn-dependent oligopeptidase